MFITSPVPVPLSVLYGDLKRTILYNPETWFGVDFDAKQARAQRAAYRAQQKKKASHSPLSADLPPDVQFLLADQVVRERTETGSLLNKAFRWNLARRWKQNLALPPEERKQWIAGLIDHLTPYEAYLLLQRIEKKEELSAKRFGKQSMEAQLLKLKRKPEVRDLIHPWERQRWLETQFHNMTAGDLEEILLHRSLNPDLAREIYLSGDETKAHEILNQLQENYPHRLRMGQDYLMKQILVPRIINLLKFPGRRLVFVNFKDAFGDRGLLRQLEENGFEVSRPK